MNSYFKNNVFLISFGTGLSKLVGFTREAFIAAAFGIGITYDAFQYAYIIPSFFLIIIGGIGGGAMLGYKLGSNIFKRGYKVEEFEGWTLDKKRNHLNSKIDQ